MEGDRFCFFSISGIGSVFVFILLSILFQFETAFRASALANSFGDTVITDIIPESDSTVAVKLLVNFKSAVNESAILQALLSQLTGSSGGQLKPNHRLIRRTFVIGEPSMLKEHSSDLMISSNFITSHLIPCDNI